MKKSRRFVGFIAVFLLICTLTVGLAACHKKGSADPEKTAFVMSIQQPDGVFNPFFATSAYDTSIISLTQIGMLSTDATGNIVCGDNEPTFVKDYTVKENKGSDQKIESTEYEFIIKNGIKDSDGNEMGIKDVLFNLYVYLDPAYTGSATVYSTDIRGLINYRLQDPNANLDSDNENLREQKFDSAAINRIDMLIKYLQFKNKGYTYPGVSYPESWYTDSANDERKAWDDDYFKGNNKDGYTFSDKNLTLSYNYINDFNYAGKLFREVVNRNWNSANLEAYKENNGFEEKWQVFLYESGEDLLKKNPDNTVYREQGTNFTKMDPQAAQAIKDRMDRDFTTHAQDYQNMTEEQKIEKWCKNYVFEGYFDTIETDGDGNEVYTNSIPGANPDKIAEVLYIWTDIYTQFKAEIKSKYYAGAMEVDSVSGITVKHYNSGDTFNGKKLDDEYYSLHIVVNKVDPKAIYNFAFNVAPMNYYSHEDEITTFNNAWEDFKNNNYDNSKLKGFGVKFNDINFMNDVVNADSKVGLPKGAGPYMASSANNTPAQNGNQFFNNNIVYYQRNENFKTVGTGEKIGNAKIKFVRYQVVGSDQIINMLTSGQIHFGDPSATTQNIEQISRKNNSKLLAYDTTPTAGYGYVGINPKYVPEVNVRRAIMKAMNTALIKNYYGNLWENLYRPMSKTNWVYDYSESLNNATLNDIKFDVSEDMTKTTNDYRYDGTGNEIEKLLQGAGYTGDAQRGYSKDIQGWGTDKLDYVFTIAGGTTDHPAHTMFLEAAKLLNAHGFNVKVVTSQTALQDLAVGALAVWAAAWSSAIDPDMYQVYHIDSQASSTSNWGYTAIKAGKNSVAYKDEYAIIEQLSTVIDKARETTDKTVRATRYNTALNLVMQLAVEFPTYQRRDLSVFNKTILDRNTMVKNPTPYYGLLAEIWNVNYI